MKLWSHWWNLVEQLRPTCARHRTFLWLTVCLAAMTVRGDLWGVTSMVRALALKEACYDRILDFFHSKALDVAKLTRRWVGVVLDFPCLLRVNGRILLLGDGVKVPKAGRKMPAVKLLHQQSQSNTKPSYIMGHSCQAVAVLAGALKSVFAIPLASRIHEGVVFSNRDKRTLLDKMVLLIDSLGILLPFYFIADAYYASRVIITGLMDKGNHLITRVRTNAVAYFPATPPRKRRRGRRRKYGRKVKLRSLFEKTDDMQKAKSPIYGEEGTWIRFLCLDLLWRPVGILVRFVAVVHPTRGSILLMCTDLTLPPVEIIRLYGLRFKIEVSFKQAIRSLGIYAYHFWMQAMTRIRRCSGNQYMHTKSDEYRQAVRRKLDAYHRHIQIGIIAQGLLHYLACLFPRLVWHSFGSWIRTVRPGTCPSEQVTAMAMRNSLPAFLTNPSHGRSLVQFLRQRMDVHRAEAIRLRA
jgi:hypothetical protein